jgi:hypothetical protein
MYRSMPSNHFTNFIILQRKMCARNPQTREMIILKLIVVVGLG